MPSKRAEEWAQAEGWRDAGYRTQPGGEPITAKGALGENVMAADRVEAQIRQTNEEPELFSPAPSTGPNHHPGPRCLGASYYPVSEVVVIAFNPTSAASGGEYMYHSVSADEWEALKAAPSLGHFINDVLSSKSYGRVG